LKKRKKQSNKQTFISFEPRKKEKNQRKTPNPHVIEEKNKLIKEKPLHPHLIEKKKQTINQYFFNTHSNE
jgi:hypothetical protein